MEGKIIEFKSYDQASRCGVERRRDGETEWRKMSWAEKGEVKSQKKCQLREQAHRCRLYSHSHNHKSILGLVSTGRFTRFVRGKNPTYEVGKLIELINIFPSTK